MVKIFRLVNGEEYIATIAETEQSILHLEDIIQIIPYQKEGGTAIGFSEFPPYCQNVALSKDAVAFMSDPTETMLQTYKSTTTKIILPETKQIIL